MLEPYVVQYCSIMTSFFHAAWCHAVFHVEDSIITSGNKILHMTRHGISRGIYMRFFMTHIIYMARLLAMEAS